ncbi:MAG: hypothetical protein QNK03_01865 [Myxococcota bacterium]|nr:hypothetical protein [Myxococcota bacterium]
MTVQNATRTTDSWRLGTALLALTVLAAATARADESDQLYLAAIEAPLGSISSAGARTTAVYLRWDQLAANLPLDLETVTLLRDGSELARLPARGVLAEEEIGALYDHPSVRTAMDRRKREIVRWLDLEDPETAVDERNFAAVLRAKLQSDPLWSFLAARIDFNVARAQHRGYLDRSVPAGPHVYELLGESDRGRVRLGLVNVQVDGRADLIAAAGGFEQVTLGRCDSTERFKDHGAVALAWQHPGGTDADRYASSIQIAGYDLWRTTENVDSLTPRDIRGLAAVAAHDGTGNVQLAGLEKVNDQPIVITGSPADEGRYRGFNAPFAQFLEARPELLARGVSPGDQRGYYLVARSLTGNYGATASLLVEVPDLVAPPAPWRVQSFDDFQERKVTLVWDHVDVRNYYESHRADREYCNLDSARLDRELRYVPADENCEDGEPLSVDLDVEHYLVYRFRDAQEAIDFFDRDGDGFADDDERGLPGEPFVGTSCDPAQPAASGIPNYLVEAGPIPASAAKIRASGRRVLEFTDDTPGNVLGDIYWYRIATRDRDGNVSPLSAPIRGVVVNRGAPPRDQLDDLVVGAQECGYEVAPLPAIDLDRPFAIDATPLGSATSLRLFCENFTPEQQSFPFRLTLPIVESNGQRGTVLSPTSCAAVQQGCDDPFVQLSFLGPGGRVLGATSYPAALFAACPNVNVELTQDCSDALVRPWEPGEALPAEQGPIIDPSDMTECVNVYRNVDGTDYRLDTLCPGDEPLDLGGLFPRQRACIGVAVADGNANASAIERLACFDRPVVQPDPPIPAALQFTAGSATAQAVFFPPAQDASGTIVEWYQNGRALRTRTFTPHPDQPVGLGAVVQDVHVEAEPAGDAWQQEWCFRGRSVAAGTPQDGTVLSDWSRPFCAVRLPEGAPVPEFIPWPKVALPPRDPNPIPARYMRDDELPILLLTPQPVPLVEDVCMEVAPACDPDDPGISPEQLDQPCFGFTGDVPIGSQCDDFCDRVSAALAGELGFVVYRQFRANPGASPSEFVQVSPLIDRAFCETGYEAGEPAGRLVDPFVEALDVETPSEPAWHGNRLVFADRYPHKTGLQYRYQLVYLDGQGAITRYRFSDWVGAF